MQDSMDRSWLCLVVLLLIMVPAIYYGARSRWRYASRIREAQARGAFTDMNTPKAMARLRRLALLALIGILGMILSIVMLLQHWVRIPISSNYILTALVVFGLVSSIAGFLIRREIDRRL